MHGLGRHWHLVDGFGRRAARIGLGGTALAAEAGGFSFVQISDTHIGIQGRGQPDPAAR